MSIYDELIAAVEKLKSLHPLVVRIEVADIADLRRFVGSPSSIADGLGVADFAGVPVYEVDDIEPGTGRSIKSDGSVEHFVFRSIDPLEEARRTLVAGNLTSRPGGFIYEHVARSRRDVEPTTFRRERLNVWDPSEAARSDDPQVGGA